MLTPISSKYLGMRLGVWNESECLICFENFMGTLQKTGDTPAHPRWGKHVSARSWWVGVGLLPDYRLGLPLFPICVRMGVLHPLPPDLFSTLLLTSLGPRRSLTSMDINRLLVLWLLIGFGQWEAQRRWEGGEREAFPCRPSAVVWRGLHSSLSTASAESSPQRTLVTCSLPPGPLVQWWSSLPPPCWVPGCFALPCWHLKLHA